MTTEITPTFDPSDNTWFTEDGYEAKSLAKLQKKLPSDVTIANYYPDGYGNIVQPRAPHITKIVNHRSPVRRFAPVPNPSKEKAPIDIPSFLPSGRRARTPSAFPKMDWSDQKVSDKCKSLVDQGLTAAQIGEQMNCSRAAIIGICTRKGWQLKG